jgi:O-acetyl-ADP-ribose deacetylase (regulator of RNase III)
MREQKIDIFNKRVLSKADAICFTSNGIITSNNRLVMGAGVAKKFKNKFSNIDYKAAKLVKENGNKCQLIGNFVTKAEDKKEYQINVVAFPTKYHWKDNSDLDLIKKSAQELIELANHYNWKLIALPKPGCFNGNLYWPIVKKEIEKILDDRVVIVYL